MNQERAALRGEKAVAEHKLKGLKMRAVGMRDLLRNELPAYLDVMNLDNEKISSYSSELVGCLAEIGETRDKLKALEEQLDG